MLLRFLNNRAVFRMESDDLLGSMQVGDEGVTFADDLGGGGEGSGEGGGTEQKTLTVEEQLAAANAQLGKYRSLDFLADALEKDPSKIHDLRGAISGEPRRESSLTEAPLDTRPKVDPNAPRTVLEAIQRLPEAERDKLNALATEKPAEYQAALADLSAKIHVDAFRAEAQPLVDGTVAREIDAFKLSKASDPIYRHAVANFDTEMRDFDRNQFYNMAPAARTRQLELRWQAAKATVYDAAAAKATPRSPRNVGGGSGGGSGGGTPGLRSAPAASSDDLKELAARSGLKPGQLERIMKDVAS